jgi:hypothetical protein
MAIVYGTQSRLILIPEKTTEYGTPATFTSGGSEVVRGITQPFVSESLKLSQQTLDSNSINAYRGRLKPALANISVSGSISTELSPQTSHFLLYAALGNVKREIVGGGFYTYTFSTESATQPSFEADVDFGSNAAAAHRWSKFTGCKISNFALQIPTNGFITANYDVIGRTGASTNASSLTLDNPPYKAASFKPFTSSNCSITIGTTTAAIVETMSLQLNNSLDESVYTLTADGLRADMPAGLQSVSGQITLLLDAADASALLTIANSSTPAPSSLTIVLSHSADEKITLTLPNVLFEKTSPEIQGPGGVKFSLNYKAFYTINSSATTPLVPALTIAVASTEDPFELSSATPPALLVPLIPKKTL